MVDTPSEAMRDKLMTNRGAPRPKTRKKKGKPHTVVRHHSISIPIYASELAGKTRYTIAFYRDGKRRRRLFSDLTKAKKEAK